MDVNALIQSTSVTLVAVAWKVAGAVVLWLVGRWLISFALKLLGRALAQQQLDVTLVRYIHTALSILLNVALVVAVLGFFGVETTTFAALIAAGGACPGLYWRPEVGPDARGPWERGNRADLFVNIWLGAACLSGAA